MNELIFIKTHRGDRTNIISGFQLWSKEMFLNDVKNNKKGWRELYRYGRIGDSVTLLKDMKLDEFEKEFNPEDFTTEQITELFRKEISLKYGEHKIKAQIKPLTKKDLVIGQTYLDFNDQHYVYLGNVKYHSIDKYNRVEEKEGLGFVYYWHKELTISEANILQLDVLKSIKKLKCKADIPIQLLEKKYSKYYKGLYSSHTVTVELLEVE